MSYASPRLLTVILLLSITSIPLAAQRNIVARELPELASPIARERAAAATRLARVEDDIAGDLRVAYKFADTSERMGLLLVAQLRGEDALVQQAAEALGSADERLTAEAQEYLLSLPFELLAPETKEFNKAQNTRWDEFQTFRIRRDIAAVLIDAHLKPGKFFSQFDTLRKFDAPRLDRELMGIMQSNPDFAAAVNLASTAAIEEDVTPQLAFQPTWRKLVTAAGAFEPALAYQSDMKQTDAIAAAQRRTGVAGYLCANEVLVSLRAIAARALADSPDSGALKPKLNLYYDSLIAQVPDPELSRVIELSPLQVEIELTLARFGETTLLDARIDNLRAQIDRVQQMKVNVNMQATSRPDLIAQNEIAHLKLRAGDLKGAEEEWASAINGAREMLREVEGRNRSSLSSYLAAVFYNLGCAQSLQGKISKAMASLKEAVANGYKDYAWMLEDGDLEQVRTSASFREWFRDSAPPSVADRLVDRD